jgi:hypothetical protein
MDLGTNVSQQRVVDDLALAVGLLIKVQDLDEVGPLPGQFLVPDDVHVQLIARDVVGLCSLTGLEVDDRGLVGVEPLDQVDAAVDGDPGCDVHLDLLFGVERQRELGAVFVEVPGDGFDRCLPQLGLEFGVGERGVEVAVDKFFDFEVGDDVAGDRALCDGAFSSVALCLCASTPTTL